MSIEEILRDCRTIAVVGLSTDPAKASHEVARYLQSAGYRIIPVHPSPAEILGEKAAAALAARAGLSVVMDRCTLIEHQRCLRMGFKFPRPL